MDVHNHLFFRRLHTYTPLIQLLLCVCVCVFLHLYVYLPSETMCLYPRWAVLDWLGQGSMSKQSEED